MLNFKITDRIDIHPRHSFLSLVLSLAAGLLVISSIFLTFGVNPLYALAKIFSGSFGSVYGLKETLTKAIPLILIGSGLAVAFRAKFWNIGAESQLLMGAIFGTWVGLNWGPHLPWPVIVPLMSSSLMSIAISTFDLRCIRILTRSRISAPSPALRRKLDRYISARPGRWRPA